RGSVAGSGDGAPAGADAPPAAGVADGRIVKTDGDGTTSGDGGKDGSGDGEGSGEVTTGVTAVLPSDEGDADVDWPLRLITTPITVPRMIATTIPTSTQSGPVSRLGG